MAIETIKHFRVLEKPVAGSDKLLIIYTAMGTKMGIYRWFVKRWNKRGYSCIIYDYPMEPVYKMHPKQIESWYDDLIADAQTRLARYKTQGVKHFYGYGVSLGTLIANKFARETPEITHVVLNLTYGDVASTIFTWWGIRKAKRAMLAHGYDLEATRELITYVDPIFNATSLRDKKVLLFLARQDQVLVWKYTKHTLQAFRDVGLDMEYIENKYLGHFLAGSKNMLNMKRLHQFYGSEKSRI